ncbi:reverse transcriptase/maturase family protein [Legionella shakespearei]|uniref:Reverse transcriptase n=1 Tax=Legionella shakespearei DSM 23087 TaxID=1122169 RepID=A0A0W0Z2V2_9GAMM|nr:reverse transcriptase/maturase family protein [Legionella shakespearei]KTD63460.1 reverse transcriptase [Legionella shakespearei DSM 23087]
MYSCCSESAAPGRAIELADLFQAYRDCRKNKRNTMNALAFEVDYEDELLALWDEIQSGTYRPGRSIAFIVNKPVKREIFAARFKDRVVHHLIINQLNPLFEKIFIHDSYACRKGKGTHRGILRASRFIRQCSQNAIQDCFILKFDIRGFFMAIDKSILWRRLHDFIVQYYSGDDYELLLFLCYQVVMNDPTRNCFIKGGEENWDGLPPDKSLFHSKPHCGLPIGNLISQIFANFYMNPFDHFMKHDLGLNYYCRYVDDALVAHEDRAYLQELIPVIFDFLSVKLKLTLHPRKIYLHHYSKGVTFLGMHIKPHCILPGKRIKGNFYDAIVRHNKVVIERKPTKDEQRAFLCSVNSYPGILKHYNTYGFRKRMLFRHLSIWWWNLMYCSGGCAKLVSRQRMAR